jgi:uncharacterized protein YjbI with pentapeptide repeats
MDDEQRGRVATAVKASPAPAGYPSWRDYWTAHGMPWRTEPEIDAQRQRYLSERRAIRPDIARGVFPFLGVTLDRADVEWLLATHESLGMVGPVSWDDERAKLEKDRRQGLDLRGADLRNASLTALPLARLLGGLTHPERMTSTHVQRHSAAVQLAGANLDRAHLEQAELGRVRLDGVNFEFAQMQQADLGGAHLEHASLRGANLAGAYLRRVFVDEATNLDGMIIGDRTLGFITIVDANWGDVNLSPIAWADVPMLGDEERARKSSTTDDAGKRHRKDRTKRIRDYEDATRANRQLAQALRAQGLNEYADRFAYRAQVLQRGVLRRQGNLLRYIGSLFLWFIAGYGYRPMRSFAAYALVVLAFATTYFALGGASGHALSWNEAIVISMTAFHGRGFFSTVFQPSDLQAGVAAVEAFVGLLIEIVFIATFTNRFFAR